MYAVLYTKASRNALKAQSRKRAKRIIAIMERIAADPFANHLNTIKGVKGSDPLLSGCLLLNTL